MQILILDLKEKKQEAILNALRNERSSLDYVGYVTAGNYNYSEFIKDEII